jgi:sugar lactone lactonase YvrE
MGGGAFAQPQYIAASDLPDYRPAFIGSGPGRLETRADADGNLWIHVNTSTGVDGGPVYDVVNRNGVLVDRVQIPGGCTIVGFAPGVMYITSRDGTGVHLARARIR